MQQAQKKSQKWNFSLFHKPLQADECGTSALTFTWLTEATQKQDLSS